MQNNGYIVYYSLPTTWLINLIRVNSKRPNSKHTFPRISLSRREPRRVARATLDTPRPRRIEIIQRRQRTRIRFGGSRKFSRPRRFLRLLRKRGYHDRRQRGRTKCFPERRKNKSPDSYDVAALSKNIIAITSPLRTMRGH